MSKDEALIAVRKLVEQFNEQYKSYHDSSYDEHKTRLAFINPFFTALGWDVENKEGVYEAYREVIPEDKQKVGGSTKAPDYGFRLQGSARRLFFVEAKKPSVPIKTDKGAAYQLRRYGRSAGTSISVLTNFKEFAVYDCSKKPKLTDSAAIARIKYLTYDQYPHLFDFLWDTFSREAVVKGRFLKFVESDTGKRGSIPLDKEFVASLDTWRKYLATSIAKNNPRITDEELGFAVQQTIDRLIFLRFCEDRAVEHYGMLKHTYERGDYYKNLLHEFEKAHDKYNSGLFDLKKDRITPALKVDNKVVRTIVEELYYPRCEYEFSVMPVEIMGNAYEQFLGKVIRVTPGHIVKIEEKPEVRKAGGVYYTPQYIVDYIVKNTVGSLIEGKSPKEIEKIKIVDPACGSGSFLLGAFQFLVDYHTSWYLRQSGVIASEERAKQSPAKFIKSGVLTPEGRLTTAEKRKILLNNIHGVDIDSNAVEVTKLSLMLKAMEGETDASIQQQLKLFHQRVLPDLDKNIVCGNSLISPDFFDGQLQVDPDERKELEKKIKPFDWKSAFPQIFKQGGFDAVIGNPPYGFHQIHSDIVKPYFKLHFNSSQGSFENYFLFYERSLKLLKDKGLHGFIVPVTWLTIPSAKSLRKFALDNYYLREVCWLPELVFKDAQVNTLVSLFEKSKANKTIIKIYDELGFNSSPKKEWSTKQDKFIDADYYIGIFESSEDTSILKKIKTASQPLSEVSKPCSGYNPYEVGTGIAPDGKPHTKETVNTKPYHSKVQKGKDWKPEIIGRDLSRYAVNISENRWIKYGPWLAAARNPDNFLGKRILVQEITGGKEKRIIAAYIDQELYHSRDVIPIKIINDSPHPYFLLAVINSTFISWYHHKRNPKAQKGLFPKILVSDLSNLPICKINSNNKSLHDQIVTQVTTMLQLNKDLQQAKLPTEKESIENRIAYTDRTLDALVYKLYGLTEEEIAIIEKE